MTDHKAALERLDGMTKGPWVVGEDSETYLYSLHVYGERIVDGEPEDISLLWVSCSEDDAQDSDTSPKLKTARINARAISAVPEFAALYRADVEEVEARGALILITANAEATAEEWEAANERWQRAVSARLAALTALAEKINATG